MCNSSSSVLVLNRTSPSLLHTFVAYSTQLSIAIQHTGNSFLHQHIPRKRLRASSCFFNFPVSRARAEKLCGFLLAATSKHVQVRLDCTSRKKILRQQKRGNFTYPMMLRGYFLSSLGGEKSIVALRKTLLSHAVLTRQ